MRTSKNIRKRKFTHRCEICILNEVNSRGVERNKDTSGNGGRSVEIADWSS